MTRLREAGLDVPGAHISGKEQIITAKAAIIDSVSTKLKEVEKTVQEQLQQSGQLTVSKLDY